MAYDMGAAKVRLGLDPTTVSPQDANIGMALRAALSAAEHYCQRGLRHQAQTDSFQQPSGALQLFRYPVDNIISISGGVGSYNLNQQYGLLDLGGGAWLPNATAYGATNEIQVEYVGGFLNYPEDLEMALWVIFDKAMTVLENPGEEADQVASIRLTGVGQISYQPADYADFRQAGGGPLGLVPKMAGQILALYKRETC